MGQRHIPYQRLVSILAGVFVCLSPVLASADDIIIMPGRQVVGGSAAPPAVLPPQNALPASGLAFDLGGSEKRKLELQLSKPLTLDIANSLQRPSSGVGSVFLDGALNFNLNDKLDITTSLGVGKSEATFQPVGSIHCQNGVLEQGSYRASDCYFINQANVLKQQQVALGLRYGSDNISTAISMFRNDSTYGQHNVNSPASTMTDPVAGASFLSLPGSNPLFPATPQPLDYLDSHSMGLGMEFQVGFTMDSAGDLQLGLQLTRVLDASYETATGFAPELQNWTIANPFDSARVNLDWSKGNFSGGIQGFYRDQVQFLNRENLNSSTTFDVYFTWRAPWNANLSVGTSNLLNAGVEDSGKTDSGLKDPFEAVYGRIPYVRYQQDL
ncbi:MAG: hypothetical protein OQJ84_05135 [Xanthomonadales bacterium]|nr:hypothetical protein [Xanthomonadales bacterium]